MESSQRHSFFDYVNFNLPRLTKAVFVGVVGVLGTVLVGNVVAAPTPFPGGHVVMLVAVAGCAVFVGLALLTRTRPWTLGLAVSAVSVLIYLLGLIVDAPAVRTGSSNGQVALWNLTLLVPIGYFVLYWALRRGVIVAHPDQRHWHD